MVVIATDGECTLEQRIWTVSFHGDSRPAGRVPASIMHANPRFALEDAVMMAIDEFGPFDPAMLV